MAEMKKDINLIFEEYKIVNAGSDHYFDYMYRNLSMAILFFTTAFLFALSKDIEYFALILVFLYIIPIFGYIFGLLYFYCISALAKLGYNAVCIEKELKGVGISGYVKENKKYKVGYVLSYGTSLVLYIVVPLISLIIGRGYIDGNKNSSLFFHENIVIEDLILNKLPLFCYVIYILFAVLIFREIWELMKKTEKE